MSSFNIEDFRKPDKTIDVVEAFKDKYDHIDITDDELTKASNFINGIENIQPIKSRQAAAICIVQAAVYIYIDEWLL